MKVIVFISMFLVTGSCFGQRPNLELGGTLGFKDEFFFHPEFDANSKFTEFHIYDIYAFLRVSKLNWGGEFGVGFEKAANYFSRTFDNNTSSGYMNLNRIQIDLSPYYYLIKKSHFKWDLQLGLRNYFNLNSVMYIPSKQELSTWKLAGRFTTNMTFKSVIVGVYFEHDMRTDYQFKPSNSVFGLRVGVLY